MRARVAWWIYAAVAGVLALVVVGNWIWAVTLRAPVLYGEGAVAHAAILARSGLEYTSGAHFGDVPTIFTAANYPPLYLNLAGIGGDPFVTGRLISIAATLFIAGAIAFRGRSAGPIVAGAIALAWVASIPVMAWGLAVKPDPLALALTVGATLALARARPLPIVAGLLLGLAVTAKPTAVVPAVALLVFVARGDRVGAARGLVAGVVGIFLGLFDRALDGGLAVHVIDWNALPWRVELLAPLVFIALLVLAVPIATVVVTRSGGGAVGAYLVGAVGVLLLGGREGATVNYFLDLSAALALAAATIAPRLSLGLRYPAASLAQLAIGVVLLNPFPTTPSLLSPTGKWVAEPSFVAYVRDLVPGTVLIEDSGLLIANGREPIVDDLFLWSRNYATGKSFREGQGLLDAVRAGTFDAIVSEADLDRIDAAPGYERQRWHPDLIAAVLERYQHTIPGVSRPGEFVRIFGRCPAFVPCRQLYVYTRR